ncbi:MAG: hypothetical protein B7X47_01180 [Ferrovum sp. 34-44-207]|nr:flagellar transcriptional regulator FlhC [Ferrovum sp. JA12]OYV79288.1 MAG: hypothetical protein B7Z65_06705 [Ferrovum sp. 21-44-67]OZB34333.1 MAG: hypothetical protein B7X47_01180 [Ferrovum sp. 34-44-207]HQU06314.1 FlhC family transcriptional regulator [Ferrovaceae bacterium]
MATSRELHTELERYHSAQQLFLVGARVPIVSELTQLSPWLLRKFYVDSTGEAPARGPIPSSVEWYLIGLNHLQSSLFLQYYMSVNEHHQPVRAATLLLAYQLWYSNWNSTGLKKTLSFDRAWWLIKLIDSEQIKGQSCRVCRSIFVVGLKRVGTYRCPACMKKSLHYGSRCKKSNYLPPREKSSISVSGIAYISSRESSSVS